MSATKLNTKIADNTLAIKLIKQCAALFRMNIEIWDRRSHSEGEHFLASRIGKAGDVVGCYRHPYWRSVEYTL